VLDKFGTWDGDSSSFYNNYSPPSRPLDNLPSYLCSPSPLTPVKEESPFLSPLLPQLGRRTLPLPPLPSLQVLALQAAESAYITVPLHCFESPELQYPPSPEQRFPISATRSEIAPSPIHSPSLHAPTPRPISLPGSPIPRPQSPRQVYSPIDWEEINRRQVSSEPEPTAPAPSPEQDNLLLHQSFVDQSVRLVIPVSTHISTSKSTPLSQLSGAPLENSSTLPSTP
jgi:hypothetical protein